MSKSIQWLYLTSSNASKEYIVDILETLSLPYGTVQHFRYQLRWLTPDLRKELPLKGGEKNETLTNIKVLICYLYQKKNNDRWEWINIFPIRTGILMDAYKTGEKDVDVAHFYFKVDNYISYNSYDFTEIIKKIAGQKWGEAYAFFEKTFDEKFVTCKQKSKSTFHEICQAINKRYFKSPDDLAYFPIFCYIDGIKDKNGKYIYPKYDSLSYKSYYEFAEGDRYSYDFTVYSPVKPPEYLVKLLCNEHIFSTPCEYTLKFDSSYYEESWGIITSLLERDIWCMISFKTELNDNYKPLNLNINFPVRIKRKIAYRIIDALGDVFFGVGTGAIALSKVLTGWTWWYWFVIPSYGIWGCCKIIIKIWRG